MDERILRARARANLRNNWGVSIAVAVVAVLLGGLITADNPYRRIVAETLSPLGTVITPAHDALWGAAQMAWEILP